MGMGLTKAEMDFYSRVPNLLLEIAGELKKLNQNIETLNQIKAEE